MAKYFITWEADEHLWPADSNEQIELGMKLGEMIKKAMNEGRLSDWGIFVGGDKGFAIGEGNAAQLYAELQQYHPYIDFMVHEVLSIDEMMEVKQSMMM